MPLIRKRILWEIAALIAGGFTIFIGLRVFGTVHHMMRDTGAPVFGDFLNFFTGGAMAMRGDTAHLYNEAANYAFQSALIPGFKLVLPYYEPPVFLLLMAPLSTLGYVPAALVFMTLSFFCYWAAAWRLVPDKRALIFAASYPTPLLHLINLQAGTIMAGFNGLALSFLQRRPILAGVFISLLSIKPHLAVLWPVMLAVRGQWKTFFSAAISLLALIAISGAIFGFDTYVAFFNNLTTAQSGITTLRTHPQVYASLYANLLTLNVPAQIASIVHGISALAAIAIAVLIWRRGEANTSAVALCAGTMLISPYLFFYDAAPLGIAALFLARTGLTPFRMAVMALAFGAGLVGLYLGQHVTPPLHASAAWALMLLAERQSRASAAPAPAPAHRT